ncbi:MAG: alpha/beta hydrolase [Dehalococcoidia bacterium]|nr:alpha/beta hydrolase [Dehalococcoidia bacterium]
MPSPEAEQLAAMFRSAPPPLESPSVEQLRANMESMAVLGGPEPGTVSEPVEAGGVPAEWIVAPGAARDRAILYLHGGGYAIGSIATHRGVLSRLSAASASAGLALDYRLAPEHPFPAAVEDAVAAYRWLLAQGIAPGRIAIAGDSAGGGLTVAALVALRDAGDPLPACAVTFSPWADLALEGASMDERDALDPMVHRPGLQQMADWYLAGQDARHPLASPIHADLAGLPPLLVQVGTAETLYDDAVRLAVRAIEAGTAVTFEPWADLFHVFQIFAMLPEAQEAVRAAGAFIARYTGG